MSNPINIRGRVKYFILIKISNLNPIYIVSPLVLGDCSYVARGCFFDKILYKFTCIIYKRKMRKKIFGNVKRRAEDSDKIGVNWIMTDRCFAYLSNNSFLNHRCSSLSYYYLLSAANVKPLQDIQI